jgi:hypothetical protein
MAPASRSSWQTGLRGIQRNPGPVPRATRATSRPARRGPAGSTSASQRRAPAHQGPHGLFPASVTQAVMPVTAPVLLAGVARRAAKGTVFLRSEPRSMAETAAALDASVDGDDVPGAGKVVMVLHRSFRCVIYDSRSSRGRDRTTVRALALLCPMSTRDMGMMGAGVRKGVHPNPRHFRRAVSMVALRVSRIVGTSLFPTALDGQHLRVRNSADIGFRLLSQQPADGLVAGGALEVHQDIALS